MVSAYNLLRISSLTTLLFSFVLVSLLYVGVIENYTLVVNIHLLLYAFLVVIDFISTKRFSLFQIWVFSFVFIILSEMIILSYEEPLISPYIPAFSYLIVANDCLLLSYILFTPSSNHQNSSRYIIINPKTLFILIVVLEFLFVFYNLAALLNSILGGKSRDLSNMGDSMGNFNALMTFVDGVGILIPALIAYYYKYCTKKSIWNGVLLLIPLFLIHFVIGTRYRLLFAVIPFFVVMGIISLGRSNLKRNLLAIVVVAVLGTMSIVIKELRATAMVSVLTSGEFSIESSSQDASVFYKIAEKMSPEGVVYMTKVSDEYFKEHNHHYGIESGYILYFWIPRVIWPNKPTQLDHWLIREVENVPDAHSSASGFTGELKADFGIFSLFFVFLMGLCLKKTDDYVHRVFSNEEQNYSMILASAVVPYVFFFVRSPLTSSYSFIFEVVFLLVMRRFICEKVEIKE